MIYPAHSIKKRGKKRKPYSAIAARCFYRALDVGLTKVKYITGVAEKVGNMPDRTRRGSPAGWFWFSS